MTSVIQRFTTDAVDADDRFDLWRTFVRGSELERPRSDWKTPFRGRLVAGGQAEDATFQDLRNSALVCRFGTRDSGLVLLAVVLEGRVGVRHSDDRREVLDRSSGLVLFDCDRPLTTHSNDLAMRCLAVPRRSALAALGRDPSVRLAPMMRLPEHGLGVVWRMHMDELARTGASLSRAGSIAALQAASALTSAILSLHATPTETELSDDVLYEAACRLVKLAADDTTLTARRLAIQLGCSRSRLYRVFEERGESIGSHVRDVRLERAAAMLVTDARTPIGPVASQCGYGDLSAFGKAFRRRFGETPSHFRERARREAVALQGRTGNGR